MKMRNPYRMHRTGSQKGLTIIELMVAMVLGLLLMAMAIHIFVGSRDTYRYNSNLARLQENGRFAFEQVSRVVRMTGYQGDSPAAWVLGPMSQSNGGVTPLAGTDNATNNSDVFTLTFMGSDDSFIKDCQGTDVAAAETVTNTFALDANNQLTCAVSLDGAAATTRMVIDRFRIEDHARGHGVDQHLVGGHVRIVARDLGKDLVPQHHAMTLGVGLGDAGQVFGGPGSGQVEGEPHDPRDPAPGEDRGLDRDLLG